METKYINKDTASVISEETVLHESEDGLVVSQNNCWKFIPKKRLREHRTFDEYYTPESPVPLEIQTNENDFLIYNEETGQDYTAKLEQRFGFRHLRIAQKRTAPASVIVSDYIKTFDASYITISCEIENPDAGAVEFSILDNTDEYAILPNKNTEIVDEFLFFGMDTRFIPDTTKEIILKEDGNIVDKNYAELTADDFAAHRYTISYTSKLASYRYIPYGDTIQVKAVIRQYKEEPFISVNNIMVHRTGEAVLWN